MDRQDEERNRNKNRIIIILLLLVVILCVYIYLGGFWANEQDEVNQSEDMIEQVEGVDDDGEDDEDDDEDYGDGDDNDDEEDELDDEGGDDEEDDNNDESDDEEGDDSVDDGEDTEEEEQVDSKPNKSTKKFGLSFSQRNEIWQKYQKKQTLIQKEAYEKEGDRFSNRYQSQVQTGLKRLSADLQKEYGINQGELDYILEEGKDGKFNDAVQSF